MALTEQYISMTSHQCVPNREEKQQEAFTPAESFWKVEENSTMNFF